MVSDSLSALQYGISLGLQYNPIFAFVGALLAAAIAGVPHVDGRRIAYSTLVLITAWLLGDGLRIMGRTQDVFFDSPTALTEVVDSPTTTAVVLVVWALASLAVGYILPAWAGAFAGSRVTRGTGWLTAIMVSSAVSFAISAIVRQSVG